MSEFPFQIRVRDSVQAAVLRLATKVEINRYHRSLSQFVGEPSAVMVEAVEFARLAAKRWRYYARSGEVVTSFGQLRREIRRDSNREIAFIALATIRQNKRDLPIGLAYCRRTWCHHLALDFLALHPRTLDQSLGISGTGSGIVFGLVRMAKAFGIPRIWGEATAHSAPFYERLLAVHPIRDLFIIESNEMAAIIKRQERTRSAILVSGPSTGV